MERKDSPQRRRDGEKGIIKIIVFLRVSVSSWFIF